MGLIARVPHPWALPVWEMDAAGVYLNELCAHAGDLYGLDRTNKKLYRWDALGTWTEVASTSETVTHLCSFNGNLYVSAAASGVGKILRFDTDTLTTVHTQNTGTGSGGGWQAGGRFFNFDDVYLYFTEGYTGVATVGYVRLDASEVAAYSTYAQSTSFYPPPGTLSPITSSRRVAADGSVYRSGANLSWEAPGSGSVPGEDYLPGVFGGKFYALDYYLFERTSFAGSWSQLKTVGYYGHCVATADLLWIIAGSSGGGNYSWRAYTYDGTRVLLDQLIYSGPSFGKPAWVSYHDGYLVVPLPNGKIWRRAA